MIDQSENLPPARNPKTAFEAFASFVARFDPIALLSQLTLTFLFTPDTGFIGEASPVRHWARLIEFTAGIVAACSVKTVEYEQFDGSSIETFEKLVDEYFNSVSVHLMMMPVSEEPNRLLLTAKIHSMYVRGDAYPHQFFEYASELYGQHNDWFKSKLGFTIEDAIRIARAIPAELEQRVNDSMERARRDAAAQADQLIRAGQSQGLSQNELRTRIGCHLHFGNAENLLSFTVEDLAHISGLDDGVCRSFLNRLSQSLGYRNPMFPETFLDPLKSPWDYNCVDERPFIGRNGKYWLFTNGMLPSVLFYTFYFDLMADKAYRPTFEASRGAFVEKKVRNYTARLFPTKAVLLNPAYPNGDEFSDVAVLHDGKVLIFQCKAKGFTRSARIGEDMNSLRKDMHAAIRAAFDQGVRARKYLHDSGEAVLNLKGRELHIDSAQITDVYLINVTFMPFHAFTTRFENIEDELGLFPEREYPFSIALGDLDIVTQLLDSPAKFLHYMNRRLALEKTSFDVDADEMDLLGFYLSRGLYFTDELVQGANDIALSGFSEEIDEFVHRKYDIGESPDPPQPPTPSGFPELIRNIESLQSMYRTDCAIALLDLSGAARAKTVELIKAAKSATESDQNQHSVSMGDPEHSRGFSFVSAPESTPPDDVFKAAFSFAALKKYAEKFGEWYGLGWKKGSPRMVDVAVTLKFPWQEDVGMDSAVRQFLAPGRRVISSNP